METTNTQQDLNNMAQQEQHKPEPPESIFAEKDNHVMTTSCEIVERLCGPSKQDIVRTGVRADNSTWIMVADGHGYDKVTDALRAQNWDEVMNLDDHFAFIENMINKVLGSIHNDLRSIQPGAEILQVRLLLPSQN